MNMEQMGNAENEKLGLKNQMQAMIAKRHGEGLEEFIYKHAATFGDYVEKDETILDTFRENPERAMDLIDPVLYH